MKLQNTIACIWYIVICNNEEIELWSGYKFRESIRV